MPSQVAKWYGGFVLNDIMWLSRKKYNKLQEDLKIAQSGSVEKFHDLREIVNRPFSERSIKIKLVYSLDEKLEDMAWSGSKGDNQNNFDGIINKH